VGADYKIETLKSKSFTFFDSLGRDADSFDYHAPALYIQDVWIPSEKFEISAALRLNQVVTDFTDKKAKKNEIDETIVAPRAHILWRHTEKLESRIAYGKGYRSPLTFFESEHGLLDDGFNVNVTDLETSDSYTYALTQTTSKSTTTVGGAWTKIKNISYIDDSGVTPSLENLSGKDVEVANIDGSFGVQVTPEWKLGVTAEKYFYQDIYKELLIVAAIEERLSFLADWDKGKWDISTTLNWIGTRDLNDYGYGDHYNTYGGTSAGSKKRRYSPAFMTVDLNIAYELNKTTTLSLGAKNLFDYVQTESPLYFNSAGDFDVAHVWGPLQGRQLYAGLKSVF
jgi:outer membrane receptor protein involved in Fe transport